MTNVRVGVPNQQGSSNRAGLTETSEFCALQNLLHAHHTCVCKYIVYLTVLQNSPTV